MARIVLALELGVVRQRKQRWISSALDEGEEIYTCSTVALKSTFTSSFYFCGLRNLIFEVLK